MVLVNAKFNLFVFIALGSSLHAVFYCDHVVKIFLLLSNRWPFFEEKLSILVCIFFNVKVMVIILVTRSTVSIRGSAQMYYWFTFSHLEAILLRFNNPAKYKRDESKILVLFLTLLSGTGGHQILSLRLPKSSKFHSLRNLCFYWPALVAIWKFDFDLCAFWLLHLLQKWNQTTKMQATSCAVWTHWKSVSDCSFFLCLTIQSLTRSLVSSVTPITGCWS